ncbi:hypothetical protein BcDW1_6528 [Botrytis cinerea BcDW1]|uniref:Uncharacterized protein n=1 Tax=Botryotinia fuckeliana (strain BcDW1) TaxID=1290391 RepID=M7TUN0_BOTF1|nr:hypothetical protein BcDW1_6528 [Botrytis cinerea BcDW1]
MRRQRRPNAQLEQFRDHRTRLPVSLSHGLTLLHVYNGDGHTFRTCQYSRGFWKADVAGEWLKIIHGRSPRCDVFDISGRAVKPGEAYEQLL